MLSDNDYAELRERLRHDLAPKPELAPELPDIRSVADWTSVYIKLSTGDYEKWTAVEGEWLREDQIQEDTVTKNWGVEVSKGNIEGHSLVHKFGRNPTVPNGSWQIINQVGSAVIPITTVATTVRVKAGGNVADTSAGAGAQEIAVQGIDGTTFEEVTAYLTTNGASASASSSISFIRVHRMWVSKAGTYGGANVGTLVVEKTAGGDVITLAVQEGQTQTAIYTIPAGKTGFLLTVHTTVSSNKQANIRCYTRENIDDIATPFSAKRIKLYWEGLSGGWNYDPMTPELKLPEKTDIWFEGYGDGASCSISVDFELVLVDDANLS